jgi:hypothetical protein
LTDYWNKGRRPFGLLGKEGEKSKRKSHQKTHREKTHQPDPNEPGCQKVLLIGKALSQHSLGWAFGFDSFLFIDTFIEEPAAQLAFLGLLLAQC